MLVFDTNVLLHAADRRSDLGTACRRRLDDSRRDSAPVYLTWSVCYEFLRVSTHPRVFRSPWTASGAWGLVHTLLGSPAFEVLVATPRHAAVLAQTLSELPDLRGSVMHDVHTAVLMREHGVSRICTRDVGFGRFPFLTVLDPLGDW